MANTPLELRHIPVLLAEVLAALQPQQGGIYVDGNLGLGGHTAAILAQGGEVIGFDWDAEAQRLARERLARWTAKITFVHRNFAQLADVLTELQITAVDGILLDLGLSSLQLEEGTRGFSFQGCQPLDMRMDRRQPENCADLLNSVSEEDLADILYYFGEERQARPIAAAVVKERGQGRISTTEDLVAIVKSAVPRRYYPKKIHVATRTFQALRIAVNHELDNLVQVLDDGPRFLKPGGRMAVISFHSLEDRLVKRKFRINRQLRLVTTKAIRPSSSECEENPRARSARLRVAEKL